MTNPRARSIGFKGACGSKSNGDPSWTYEVAPYVRGVSVTSSRLRISALVNAFVKIAPDPDRAAAQKRPLTSLNNMPLIERECRQGA
jgi:hypothetical protein